MLEPAPECAAPPSRLTGSIMPHDMNTRRAALLKPSHQEENFMLTGRHVWSFGITAALSLGSPVGGTGSFDQKAFEAAQAAGKPILIEVSAPWCPTCKAQAPILSRLRNEPRFQALVSFNIDFDSQKDLLQKFGVQRQSTLIVFKGKQEAGDRPAYNAASIEALLESRSTTP
jgi:thiol-disulfide isomerase/thioredoxin